MAAGDASTVILDSSRGGEASMIAIRFYRCLFEC